ncbi:SCO4983 family protein [Streptomyces luteolus]|uniref:HPt domain-containing protein n=1 Tax=Streptomyces luteolus TaxID=3043615 RepID=A0ABT6SVC3_9ACTN|nr:hypothetical protein [Streptomyces sp. B-S-A12]MDI3419557.1 hypothetical protein [Streptomyces sp. B-S-A12]
MYEPIRSKSVHALAGRGQNPGQDFPHRSREEELDIQLAGHLAALLAVTDELRAVVPSGDLADAAEQLAAEIARLRGGESPVRSAVAAAIHEPYLAGLHRRAHALAGRALVVAASRADTAAAILAAERMDAHTAALRDREPAGAAQ